MAYSAHCVVPPILVITLYCFFWIRRRTLLFTAFNRRTIQHDAAFCMQNPLGPHPSALSARTIRAVACRNHHAPGRLHSRSTILFRPSFLFCCPSSSLLLFHSLDTLLKLVSFLCLWKCCFPKRYTPNLWTMQWKIGKCDKKYERRGRSVVLDEA